jgi:hypothetical protein
MTVVEEERVATTVPLDCMPSRSLVLPTKLIFATTCRRREWVPAPLFEHVAGELSGRLIEKTGPRSRGGVP